MFYLYSIHLAYSIYCWWYSILKGVSLHDFISTILNNRYAINNSCRILLLLISWQSLYYPDFLKSYSSPSITSPQSCTPSLNQYVRLASKSFTVIGFIRYFSSTHSLTMRWFSVFTFGNFQACSCKSFIYAVSDVFQFSPKSLLEKTLCSFTHSIIHFFALSIIQ